MSDYFVLPGGRRFVPQVDPLPLPTLAKDFLVTWENACVLKHDYQTQQANERYAYSPRQAARQTEVPETVQLQPFGGSSTIKLDAELQRFIAATMWIAYPSLSWDQVVQRWHEFTRTSVVMTDNGGSWDQGCTDYLFGTNLAADDPIRWNDHALTGGNALKLISKNARTFEAIDPTARPLPNPKQLYQEKPWLFFWLTQCYWTETGRRELIDGKQRKQYKVARGPHFAPVGTLLPILAVGGVGRLKDAWRIQPIAKGVTYSPYVL